VTLDALCRCLVCVADTTRARREIIGPRGGSTQARRKKRELSHHPAGFNHHGLCWPPRPSAVRCRAESSARASGRLQVIIIAAAAAICCVDGWMGGWCAECRHISIVQPPFARACLLARLSCLSIACCAIRSELQSRLSRPKGGQTRAFWLSVGFGVVGRPGESRACR